MNIDFFKKIRILDSGMGQELLARGLITKGTLWYGDLKYLRYSNLLLIILVSLNSMQAIKLIKNIKFFKN